MACITVQVPDVGVSPTPSPGSPGIRSIIPYVAVGVLLFVLMRK